MKKKIFTVFLVGALSMAMVGVMSSCGQTKAYDYDLSKYVTLGEYKGLEVSDIKVKVTDEEVQDEINSRLEKAAKTENVKEGEVKDGDTINISYEGKIDGKTFENGSAESYDMTIGTTPMIDGFSEGLIGAKVGDTVTLNLKFPKDYHDDKVAGKDVVFTVTVNAKKVTKVPEFNLAFVKENSEAKSISEYKKLVKEDVYKSKYKDAEVEQKNALWEKITAASKIIDYPEVELKAKIKDTKASYEALAKQYNMEYADFIKQSMQMSVEDFDKSLEDYAKTVVGQEMIMYAIADKENLEVTDKEYDEYIKNLLDEAGFTEKTFEDAYGQTIEQYGKEKGFRTGLLLDKVLDVVVENGVKAKN
ncbi:MAG: trigger factor [Eubacteriales bacterium]|nr:trigger factor [Eubacteriales bacterium]